MKIAAIGFDCFHTLIDLRFADLPRIELPQGEVASSAGNIAVALDQLGQARDVVDIHYGLVQSWQNAEVQRQETLTEVHVHDRLKWLCAHLGISGDEETIFAIAAAHAQTLLGATRPVEGALETLEALHGRVKLGLLSNFDRTQTVHDALQMHGMDQYFDVIMVSADEQLVKPHPDLFTRMAKRLDAAPDEMMFVGDQPAADIAGAQAAGMLAVWYAYDPSRAKDLPQGARTLEKLTGLLGS